MSIKGRLTVRRRRFFNRSISYRLLDLRLQKVESDHLTLLKVESDLAPVSLPGRQLAGYALVAMVLIILASFVVYKFVYKRDFSFLMEFASYALAALAAVVVGMGLFFRQERKWFWYSSGLVLLGLTAFLLSKSPLVDITYLVIAFNSALAAIILIPVHLKRKRAEGKEADRRTLWVFGIICLIGLLSAGGLVRAFILSPHISLPAELKCVESGKDNAGKLHMVCDPPSDD